MRRPISEIWDIRLEEQMTIGNGQILLRTTAPPLPTTQVPSRWYNPFLRNGTSGEKNKGLSAVSRKFRKSFVRHYQRLKSHHGKTGHFWDRWNSVTKVKDDWRCLKRFERYFPTSAHRRSPISMRQPVSELSNIFIKNKRHFRRLLYKN